MKCRDASAIDRASKTLLAFLASAFLASGPTLAETSLEYRFLWDQANAQMATAHTAQDYLGAARTYQELLGAGVVNGPLLYNMGTALLLGKQYTAAATALEQSERYMGSSPAAQQNLRIALAGPDGDPMESLPWSRVVLFWHYGLATATRITVACAAFSLLCLGAAMRLLGWHRLAVRCMMVAGIILIVFGSSVLTSLSEESGLDYELSPPPAAEEEASP